MLHDCCLYQAVFWYWTKSPPNRVSKCWCENHKMPLVQMPSTSHERLKSSLDASKQALSCRPDAVWKSPSKVCSLCSSVRVCSLAMSSFVSVAFASPSPGARGSVCQLANAHQPHRVPITCQLPAHPTTQQAQRLQAPQHEGKTWLAVRLGAHSQC